MDLGLFMMPAHPPERSLAEAHEIDLGILRDADRLVLPRVRDLTPSPEDEIAHA